MDIQKLPGISLLEKFFKKKVRNIGIDLGSNTIKLVELAYDQDNKVHQVMSFGITPTPPGSFVDGTVKQGAPLVAAVQRLVSEKEIEKNTTVNLGISGKQVITRLMRLPQMPLEDLEQAVGFEAEKYITVPLDQLFYDFTIVGESEVEGVPHYNLLLAGAPKKNIYELCQVISQAGLSPHAIEVEPIAVYRTWCAFYKDKDLTNQAIMNIGHKNSDIVFMKDDSLQFTRLIPVAGSKITESIIDALGREVAAAEDFKRSQKVIHLNQYRSTEDISYDEKRAQEIIGEAVAELTSEIRRSIDFYQMQAKVRMDRLIITGGTASLQGFDSYLEEELGMPVLVGGYGELEPAFSVASGLALRELMPI